MFLVPGGERGGGVTYKPRKRMTWKRALTKLADKAWVWVLAAVGGAILAIFAVGAAAEFVVRFFEKRGV